jgi:Zn finger protein HypA/HybF involved in hydrogenase expression
MSSTQQPSPIFELIDPKCLKPHPAYFSIYGEEDDISEVMGLIANQQYPRALLINTENAIINGHLYWKAALSLRWNRIPVEIREFADSETELEAILLENIQRQKTNEQKVREALAWEMVEKAKAKQRQKLAAIGTNEKLGRGEEQADKENFPEALKGQTRDRVAQKVGLGSGRNYSKAKKVVVSIDNLIESGNIESALNLRQVLNEQSIDAAIKLIEAPPQIKEKTQGLETQKPSCWNCKHCSQEKLEDNHTYYCDKLGWLSFLEQDGETRAKSCSIWSYRLDESENAVFEEVEEVDSHFSVSQASYPLPTALTNQTVTNSSSYFTLLLPEQLKPLMEDAAKTLGMGLVDWATHYLLQAIESSKAEAKINH